MSKTLGPKTNFRVVVEPRGLGDFGSIRTSESFFYGNTPAEKARMQRDKEDRANEVLADVKRHVDNVDSAWVEFDQEALCEHCGSSWTEKSTTYNGGCCDADEAANPDTTEAA